jgi:hypothetical protein
MDSIVNCECILFLGCHALLNFPVTLRKIPRPVKQKSEIFLRKFRRGLCYIFAAIITRIFCINSSTSSLNRGFASISSSTWCRLL